MRTFARFATVAKRGLMSVKTMASTTTTAVSPMLCMSQ